MPKITKVQYNSMTRRVLVYIDHRLCASIRQGVWNEMNIQEGFEITPDELYRNELKIWSQLKKTKAIYSPKEAITKTIKWLNQNLPSLEARAFEHEFNTNDVRVSANNPRIHHDSGIDLYIKGTDIEVLTLNVTSVDVQRGTSYWVSLDKIINAQNQIKKDVWIAIHYKHPIRQFVWIRPDKNKTYEKDDTEASKATKNSFIAFNETSTEIYSSEKFCEYVQNKINSIVLP